MHALSPDSSARACVDVAGYEETSSSGTVFACHVTQHISCVCGPGPALAELNKLLSARGCVCTSKLSCPLCLRLWRSEASPWSVRVSIAAFAYCWFICGNPRDSDSILWWRRWAAQELRFVQMELLELSQQTELESLCSAVECMIQQDPHHAQQLPHDQSR